MSENRDLDNRFTYHAPTPAQAQTYDYLRKCARNMAGIIDERCPDSREKSLAMTHLEEAVMWANASIARNQ